MEPVCIKPPSLTAEPATTTAPPTCAVEIGGCRASRWRSIPSGFVDLFTAANLHDEHYVR